MDFDCQLPSVLPPGAGSHDAGDAGGRTLEHALWRTHNACALKKFSTGEVVTGIDIRRGKAREGTERGASPPEAARVRARATQLRHIRLDVNASA